MAIQNPSDLYRKDPVKACRLALRRTRGVSYKNRMEKIDSLLGTHGVEAINGSWQNGYWCDILATFCNTGDSYAVTVVHLRGDSWWDEAGRFMVCSLGYLIEKGESGPLKEEVE